MEIKPGISLATVSAVLHTKDNKHVLQVLRVYGRLGGDPGETSFPQVALPTQPASSSPYPKQTLTIGLSKPHGLETQKALPTDS